MKSYTVYELIDNGQVVNRAYIPEAFSITAAVLSILWLFYHRIWSGVLITGFLSLLIVKSEETEMISVNSVIVLLIGLSVCIGYSAYDMLRRKLQSKNYQLTDVILASSLEEAEYKYLKEHVISDK